LFLGIANRAQAWYNSYQVVRACADDKRIRQRSLAVGAVLFVVGFLLQLIATF